jgi:hypothetical protein
MTEHSRLGSSLSTTRRAFALPAKVQVSAALAATSAPWCRPASHAGLAQAVLCRGEPTLRAEHLRLARALYAARSVGYVLPLTARCAQAVSQAVEASLTEVLGRELGMGLPT